MSNHIKTFFVCASVALWGVCYAFAGHSIGYLNAAEDYAPHAFHAALK